jgi:hypothetical protein
VFGGVTALRCSKRRRVLNRMACFVTQLRNVLDDLLDESHEAVTLVVKRGR